jgi:hypothetical protein
MFPSHKPNLTNNLPEAIPECQIAFQFGHDCGAGSSGYCRSCVPWASAAKIIGAYFLDCLLDSDYCAWSNGRFDKKL